MKKEKERKKGGQIKEREKERERHKLFREHKKRKEEINKKIVNETFPF